MNGKTHEKTQTGLIHVNEKTQTGLIHVNGKTQTGLIHVNGKTQTGLIYVNRKTQTGLIHVNEKIQKKFSVINAQQIVASLSNGDVLIVDCPMSSNNSGPSSSTNGISAGEQPKLMGMAVEYKKLHK